MISSAIAAEPLTRPHNVFEYLIGGGFLRHRVNEPDPAPLVHHRTKPQRIAHVIFYRLWLDRVRILARMMKTKTRLEAERIEMSIPRLPAHPMR